MSATMKPETAAKLAELLTFLNESSIPIEVIAAKYKVHPTVIKSVSTLFRKMGLPVGRRDEIMRKQVSERMKAMSAAARAAQPVAEPAPLYRPLTNGSTERVF